MASVRILFYPVFVGDPGSFFFPSSQNCSGGSSQPFKEQTPPSHRSPIELGEKVDSSDELQLAQRDLKRGQRSLRMDLRVGHDKGANDHIGPVPAPVSLLQNTKDHLANEQSA